MLAQSGLARECRQIVGANFEQKAEALAKRARLVQPDQGPAVVMTAIPVRGSRWPTRFRAALAGASNEDERRTLEKADRDSQLTRLAAALRLADFPVVRLADQSADPEALLRMAAGSKRARTVRARVLNFRRMTGWMQTSTGRAWPPTVVNLIDYLRDVVDGGAPRTVPDQIAGMISFMELAGSVPLAARFSVHPLWLASVRDASARLAANAPMPHKAPRFPMAFVAGLEDIVVDNMVPDFKKFIAWCRLVKLWAALRSDDTEGINPALLRLTPAGLEGTLDRSKTSGPGRKVRHLPFVVSGGAFVKHAGWLRQGFEILTSREFSFPRDYLVPAAEPCYGTVVRRMARYSDRAVYGRAVLMDMPGQGSEELPAEGALLEHSVAASFWTEHSERNFLTTVAAAIGIEKSQRDYIGRWKPGEQSDDYVRSTRQIVTALQDRVAKSLREEPSAVDEEDLYDELSAHLLSGGVPAAEVPDAIDRLRPTWAFEGDEEDTRPGARTPLAASPLAPAGPASDDEPVAPPTPGREGYWMSITRNRQFRCLHRFGGCYFRPGVNVRCFELIKDVGEAVFDSRCLLCFEVDGKVRAAKGIGPVVDVEADEVDDAASASESSSSDSS